MVLRVPGSGREVFAELKNRGVEDVFVAVCDGMKGLLEVISTTWEKTVVQQCIAHPDPQQLPLRRPAASGCDRSLAQTGLHGPVRGRDRRGAGLPGDRQAHRGDDCSVKSHAADAMSTARTAAPGTPVGPVDMVP